MDSDKSLTAIFEESADDGVAEGDDGSEGTPGFTSTLLLIAVIAVVAIYRKKR